MGAPVVVHDAAKLATSVAILMFAQSLILGAPLSRHRDMVGQAEVAYMSGACRGVFGVAHDPLPLTRITLQKGDETYVAGQGTAEHKGGNRIDIAVRFPEELFGSRRTNSASLTTILAETLLSGMVLHPRPGGRDG